jgi:AAA domain
VDAERALVSTIANWRQGIEKLDDFADEDFVHDDCAKVVRFIREHKAKHGEQPSVPVILEHIPFDFELPGDKPDALLEMFRKGLVRRETIKATRTLARAANEKDSNLVELVRSEFSKIERAAAPAAGNGEQSSDPTGWETVYIHEAEAPEPPDIAGLFYAGGLHLVSGEPSSMKTWLMLVAAVEVIRDGGAVMFVSFAGESGKGEIVERLRQLGLSEREIIRFQFIEPRTPLTSARALEVVKMQVEGWAPILRLVVLDSAGSALELHGLDSNSERDVQRFAREVVGPFRATGAAVALIDHVPKDRDTRGKFAIGSQRKAGMTDVHLGLEMVREFGRGREGKATITTKRDRMGQLPASGELRLASDPETGDVRYKITLREAGAEWVPTAIMRKVSRHLVSLTPEGASGHEIEMQKFGKRAADVRTALDLLVRDGYVRREKRAGRGGGFDYFSIRLYVEDEPEGEDSSVFLKDKPEAETEDES